MSPRRRLQVIAAASFILVFAHCARHTASSPATNPAPAAPESAPIAAAPAAAVGLAASTTTTKTTLAPPLAKAPVCFKLDYHHLPTAGHIDEESCSQHRNVLKLNHSRVTAVCVRVNGRPVRYQRLKGHADQIVLEPVAGPQSKISVRYCTEKAGCPAQDCKIPKDEFMSALGGEAPGESGDAPADGGVWDPAEAKETTRMNGEIRRELAELDSTSGADTGASHLFKGWSLDRVNEGCL